MSKKTTNDQQASITFQSPLSRKTMLEKLAFSLGLRRLVEGMEQGNVSSVVNLIIEFAFESKDLFSAWLKARAEKAMQE